MCYKLYRLFKAVRFFLLAALLFLLTQHSLASVRGLSILEFTPNNGHLIIPLHIAKSKSDTLPATDSQIEWNLAESLLEDVEITLTFETGLATQGELYEVNHQTSVQVTEFNGGSTVSFHPTSATGKLFLNYPLADHDGCRITIKQTQNQQFHSLFRNSHECETKILEKFNHQYYPRDSAYIRIYAHLVDAPQSKPNATQQPPCLTLSPLRDNTLLPVISYNHIGQPAVIQPEASKTGTELGWQPLTKEEKDSQPEPLTTGVSLKQVFIPLYETSQKEAFTLFSPAYPVNRVSNSYKKWKQMLQTLAEKTQLTDIFELHSDFQLRLIETITAEHSNTPLTPIQNCTRGIC